jgi:hypothetical protein
LTGNTQFKLAFWRIRRNWSELLKDFQKKKEKIFKLLKKQGHESFEDEYYLTVYTHRIQNHADTIAALEKELGS